MKPSIYAGSVTMLIMLVSGCASPPPGISVARALCEIKLGFIKDEANFPNKKIGVIPSTISIELVVEATQTSKGQVELGLARASTPTTVGLLFSKDREFKNQSTITINFVNRLTLEQSTIAGKSGSSNQENSREFSGEAGGLMDDLFPERQKSPSANGSSSTKTSAESNKNFDCASLDRTA